MNKQWKFFWHVSVWTCLLSLFFFFVYSSNQVTLNYALVIVFVYGAVNIGLFYLNYLWLIPAYLDKKHYGRYIVAVMLTTIIVGLIKYGMKLMFEGALSGTKAEALTFWPYFISTLFSSLMFVFFSITLQFTIDWFLNERIQRDLENQRLNAELSFLKSQVNPHFLFNSLNSIYSLAYQRSETTPEAILKLSEIMRYMLYESNDNKVDLEKEVHYLQNYIDLQKIRFGHKAFVEFDVNGTIDNQRIAPLLLISFIENAFKHGVANDPQKPIKMQMNLQSGRLDFSVENKKHANNRDATGGIGLSNVKRRLNLLYPGKHSLVINEDELTYTCKLSISL
ncbi:hypothetical protein DJ568_12170 [Mucilaginibacter hurinus]|uniref:Signal transduction histidine kinase internal region domain-containing protein n=1 Tax=Mucilaginibacter hurinus TaxID=2201324 RepID=A0A367GMN6_9SPHI|nr:sensor histidine kinase [Mucilaginibacter hurinus]RCH54570.1 hypothetical protein DJ568_12170 [Mucilaginibacter hurinus]